MQGILSPDDLTGPAEDELEPQDCLRCLHVAAVRRAELIGLDFALQVLDEACAALQSLRRCSI